ncbi:CACTA en-spm transposon protein [Cucumis melo var. makuwa]|uniref:CACTA en-spm transposon protein n=1 Tax=Cucumis melo var. makuwa TaxID=1194695 RepID=A0A5D3BVP6_CUCMM|nr:CACTA en-spm transposon protein [Cucumis melo var. makuwa]
MRWHRDKRVETDDVLIYPVDAEGWKHFDSEYPDFASNPRDVCLGLASDGFNSFGQMSTSYSQFFQLYAVLLWTINDFSTYGDLSGWSTKGYQACLICMDDRSSFGIQEIKLILILIRKHLRLQRQHAQNAMDLYKRHERAFPEWFRAQVLELRESANLSEDFFSLAMEASFDVHCYNGCIVGGLRFHTVELDSRHTTQNSGVMVFSESDASESGDNNFYGVLDEIIDVDPTIVERSIVHHVTDDFIDDVDEHLSHAKTDAIFLEFEDELDNFTGGSSSVGDNTVWSSSQQPATPTPRRHAQSQLLELKRHVAVHGCILMTIAPGVEKPISPHVVRFSQAIGMCMRKTFFVCYLKWADVGREYIERFFVLDFNGQAMNRSNHVRTRLLDRSNLTIIAVGQSRFYNDSTCSLRRKGSRSTVWSYLEKHTFEQGRSCRRPQRMRMCWIDDQATQKALVRDPSRRPARQRVQAVPRHLVCHPHKKRLNYNLNLMKLWNRLKCKIEVRSVSFTVERMQKLIEDLTWAHKDHPMIPSFARLKEFEGHLSREDFPAPMISSIKTTSGEVFPTSLISSTKTTSR